VTLDSQSPDIAQGVDARRAEGKATAEQGAGDQGMMFGYACDETPELMPMPIMLAHRLMNRLTEMRQKGELKYLRPDAKSQVTVEYDGDRPVRVDTVVVSTQHDESATHGRIEADVVKMIKSEIPAALIDKKTRFLVNPTGKFVVGGPHGDCGLTGRKIIVDTYGGMGRHGGGAFSGKDPSKVDRSAAYATRHIAKNLVAAGICDEALVQVAYAIGVAQPVGLYVNTYGTAHVDLTDGEIAQRVSAIFDMRPFAIVERFGLTNPIFEPTAAYGHMGRDPFEQEVTLIQNGKEVTKKVQFFGWEKLDYVDRIKAAF
jgi:S-adenosylmethionine synthetase